MAGDGIESLRCCTAPALETIKLIYQSSHDAEHLKRCRCGVYWFYRYNEYPMGDDDDWTIWYTRLSDLEAQRILDAAGRPDLAFLEEKPSIMIDSSGTRDVHGQPDEPRY